MTLLAALVEIVARTEATLARCQRGDATPQTLLELTLHRATILEGVANPPVAGAAERSLVTQLQHLDALLVQWCIDAQRDLERARSHLTHRDESPAATAPDSARVLSDIA